MIVTRRLYVPVLTLLILGSSSLIAQSLSVDTPAPLKAGTNSAVIDSFGGNQFWQFTAGPGAFTITFTYGNRQEGFNTGGKPTVFAGFRPKLPGGVINQKDFPGGTTFTGTTDKAGVVKIAVAPAPGSLVRQTTPYTLEAAGHVSFGSDAASGPSVVGVYAVKSGTSDHGVAKLTADGNIVTTSGERGHWELFDVASRVYTLSIGNDHYSAIFQPGRGFIDAQTSNLILEMRH